LNDNLFNFGVAPLEQIEQYVERGANLLDNVWTNWWGKKEDGAYYINLDSLWMDSFDQCVLAQLGKTLLGHEHSCYVGAARELFNGLFHQTVNGQSVQFSIFDLSVYHGFEEPNYSSYICIQWTNLWTAKINERRASAGLSI
jgi:hypothetical protein